MSYILSRTKHSLLSFCPKYIPAEIFVTHRVYTRNTLASKCSRAMHSHLAMRNPCNGSLSHEFMHVAAAENGIVSTVISHRKRQAFLAPLKCLSAVSRLTAAMKYASPSRHAAPTLPAILF